MAPKTAKLLNDLSKEQLYANYKAVELRIGGIEFESLYDLFIAVRDLFQSAATARECALVVKA